MIVGNLYEMASTDVHVPMDGLVDRRVRLEATRVTFERPTERWAPRAPVAPTSSREVCWRANRDTDDPRESPGLEILELLLAKEARADYSDPHIPRLPIGRRHKLDLTSVALTEAALRAFDAAVLVTDHSAYPYELIHGAVPLIVDTRNAFRSRGLQGSHIVSAQ
jgi:hypothetical protein